MKTIELNDKWFRILGMPFMGVFGRWLFYGSRRDEILPSPIYGYIISVVTVILLWEVCRKIIIISRQKYPAFDHATSRITFQLSFLLATIIIIRVLAWIVVLFTFNYNLYPIFPEFFYSVVVTFLCVLPVIAAYEGIYFFQSWKAANIEAQELKKLNLQTQLDSLKAEINPHFLFNNLNALSALIDQDSLKAEIFLEELSSVYRYLLQKKVESLSLIADEIKFIESYTFLLQVRYAGGLEVNISNDKTYSNYLIPSLTLQSLVENSVRHNVISTRKPLKIAIYFENEKIAVENTFQKKIRAIEKNKMTLNSILLKYELLTKKKVEIEQTPLLFKVSLPLIKQYN